MCDLSIINNKNKNNLIGLGYENIEDYIEKSSNEILFDDVWGWRLKSAIKEEILFLEEQEYFIILYCIIKKMLLKGGQFEDSSHGVGQLLINKCNMDEKIDIAKEVTYFLLNNPDYGKDGNGIWISRCNCD